MTVVIQPIARTGAHGDRATSQQPYRDYDIHVVPEDDGSWEVSDLGEHTMVHQIKGYDHFGSHVLNRDQVRKDAEDWANRLAVRIGENVEWAADGLVFKVEMVAVILAANGEEAKHLFSQQHLAGELRPHATALEKDPSR